MRSIKIFLAEHLEKTEIFEMAFSRKEFKNKVENSLQQIVAHLFMIFLVKDLQRSEKNIIHWLQEIDSYVSSLQDMRIDADKKKAYLEVLDNFEADNTELIRKWCLKKLKEEKRQDRSDFKDITEKDINFEIYLKIIKFIYNDIIEVIKLPLHIDTENELAVLLKID